MCMSTFTIPEQLKAFSKSLTVWQWQKPGWRSRYSDWLRAWRHRGRSSSPGRVKFLSFPYRPDRLWGPPNLLPNGYKVELSAGVKRPALTTQCTVLYCTVLYCTVYCILYNVLYCTEYTAYCILYNELHCMLYCILYIVLHCTEQASTACYGDSFIFFTHTHTHARARACVCVCVEVEVPTVVVMKTHTLWYVVPCSQPTFRRNLSHSSSGSKNKPSKKQA
jgi:hypothetical protein